MHDFADHVLVLDLDMVIATYSAFRARRNRSEFLFWLREVNALH